MDKKKCTAIVLSAGQGKRMGSAIQKQYIELSGKPIIFYTLNAFQKSAIIDDIVLVVGEGQENWVRDEIVEKYQLTKVRSIIPGGKERPYGQDYADFMLSKNSRNTYSFMMAPECLWTSRFLRVDMKM